MSTASSNSKPTLAQLGGVKGLFRNPGLVLMTLRRAFYIGEDNFDNRYYQQRVTVAGGRPRRWVVYAGAPDASTISPEWHAWLHHLTENVLPDTGRKLWQKPHQANLTGTAAGYRPAGHDYQGGNRAHASGDYQSWTPDI